MYTHKLSRNITTDAGTFDALTLDFDALSFADLRSISTIRKMYESSEAMLEPRTDFGFCVATAFVAAVKATKGLLMQDVVKLSIEDVLALHDIAQDECFFRTKPSGA